MPENEPTLSPEEVAHQLVARKVGGLLEGILEQPVKSFVVVAHLDDGRVQTVAKVDQFDLTGRVNIARALAIGAGQVLK